MTGSADNTGTTRLPGRPSLLTVDQVARAAFDLVDAEGAAALTMGRLAKVLGVAPMTIYGYAESKRAIVQMLPDLLFADLEPVDSAQPWEDVVEQLFLAVYRRFLLHGHVTMAIVDSAAFGRAQAAVIEQVLDRLDRAGMSDEDAFELQRSLATYTVGFALFAIAEAGAGAHRPRAERPRELDADEFPHVTRVRALFARPIDEQQYLRGVRRILRVWTSAD